MRHIVTICLFAFAHLSVAQSTESFEGPKSVNGTSIFVKTMGAGEPILFLHGGPGLSHDYFLPHVAPLADKHRLIFYDQRGSGRSAVNLTADDMSMAHFVEDINFLMAELQIEKVHLLGHSFGGLIAMQFAIKYPEKVKSLILCNSVAASKEFDELSARNQQEAMTPQDDAARKAIFASEHFKNGAPEAYELLFKVGFKRSFSDTLKVDQLGLNLNSNFAASSKLLYGLSGDLMAYDLHANLASLQMPALVIHGSADLLPAEAGKKLAATLPGSQYVAFEQSGHFPFIEQPVEFSKVIADFVNTTTD